MFKKLSDEEEEKLFKEIAEKYCKREEDFLNFSYENSDSYTLMFHVAEGKTEKGLWVDDFGFGNLKYRKVGVGKGILMQWKNLKSCINIWNVFKTAVGNIFRRVNYL